MRIDAAPPRRLNRRVNPRFVLALALTALLATGCFTVSGASEHAIPGVKGRASSDFDCPQSDIRVTKEWGGRFEAIGCGKKAVYNTACEGLKCTLAPEGEAVPWRARPDPSPTTP